MDKLFDINLIGFMFRMADLSSNNCLASSWNLSSEEISFNLKFGLTYFHLLFYLKICKKLARFLFLLRIYPDDVCIFVETTQT